MIQGVDQNRNLQALVIEAHLAFKKEYYTSPKCVVFLENFQKELQELIGKYFDDPEEGDILTNHQYNSLKNLTHNINEFLTD